MVLKDYFETVKGLGILATADSEGRPDAAIYARPHVMADGQLAFIMRDRLTHDNISANPQAVYLFKEDGAGYKGKRLNLVKVREEQDSELLASLRRRSYPDTSNEAKFLVFFKVTGERPLVGNGA